jgi:hypothetical protein
MFLLGDLTRLTLRLDQGSKLIYASFVNGLQESNAT